MLTVADDKSTRAPSPPRSPGSSVAPTVTWDDAGMRTSYANVVNGTSTREEITLFFGTNLTWNPAETKAFSVRLNYRIVLSPYAAKRLWLLMGAMLKEYETRFGALTMDLPGTEIRSPRSARG
jgi:hypothetical protein